MRDHRTWTRISVACLALMVGPAASAAGYRPEAAGGLEGGPRRPGRSPSKIDRLLSEKWAEAKVVPRRPGRRRRVSPAGSASTSSARSRRRPEAREFLDDPRPRQEGPAGSSGSSTARPTPPGPPTSGASSSSPRADTESQARLRRAPPSRHGSAKKVVEDVGYDKMVREILTARLGARNRQPGPAPGPSRRPAAFYIAKEGKPENLARRRVSRSSSASGSSAPSATNHPFAKWKREEFWGLAAFFAGVQKQGPDDGLGAIREVANRRELAIPGTEKIVKAAFLGEPPPTWKA